jgi:rhodanese-related sulfurtransferase
MTEVPNGGQPIAVVSEEGLRGQSACRFLAEHGFAATRMEDIAAAAAVQKASLYYYFDSKKTLLTSLVEGGLAQHSKCSR